MINMKERILHCDNDDCSSAEPIVDCDYRETLTNLGWGLDVNVNGEIGDLCPTCDCTA
jgi:hypothetical protein